MFWWKISNATKLVGTYFPFVNLSGMFKRVIDASILRQNITQCLHTIGLAGPQFNIGSRDGYYIIGGIALDAVYRGN
jgi:hypothetical protein